jgi:hypothetical protein
VAVACASMPRADGGGGGAVLSEGLLSGSVEVSGAAPAADTELVSWLSSHSLERYHASLASQGYDRLIFLRGMKGDELSELVGNLKMKAPHARAFRAALVQLDQPAAAAAVTVVAAAAAAEHEPLSVVTVAAEPVLVDQVQPGATAWLRVPSGPWINKWVPCDVLAHAPRGGGFNVRPQPEYIGATPDWENSRLKQGWQNRQPSDLRRHLQVGMSAAQPGRKWVAGEKFGCPACGGIGIKKSGSPAWCVQRPAAFAWIASRPEPRKICAIIHHAALRQASQQVRSLGSQPRIVPFSTAAAAAAVGCLHSLPC